MTSTQLTEQIKKKKSFLCIGLDVDLDKIPKHLLALEDPIFEFNKQIIDATHQFAVAYKPNVAFYEASGIKGWQALEKTSAYLKNNYPDIFTIADAKRGDIGNTSTRYAKTFFENLNFDALTVAPYMGRDSVEPFLSFENKTTILLALTSNSGGADFQNLKFNEEQLYQTVIKTALTYKNSQNLMFVVGATRPEYLKEIRKIIPNHFLLVPGVGAQGGSVEDVCINGLNDAGGLLINSSRGIIYASSGLDFAQIAKEKASELQQQMAKFI
ncbi:MAG: orotidine-5'-phosphate decarboxylase [Flavobacteriales bacterium]|nr:orotidine-5'-phosphate decarboxylase [Flavobacteriales bacterium]